MIKEPLIREDTHKKVFFVSGRTTQRGGGKPPEPLRKKEKKILSLKKSDQNLINH